MEAPSGNVALESPPAAEPKLAILTPANSAIFYPRCFACLRILDPELRLKEFA
jgi:hypothetical protein